MNVQAYYDRYEAALRAVKAANQLGKAERSRAFQLLNKYRAELRHVQRGTKPKQKLVGDFKTTVAGIPCQVLVVDIIPAEGDGWENEYHAEQVDFILLSVSGYHAPWLEAKLTDDDRERIEQMAINKQECLA